jgi:hypothetical protein
LGWIVTVEEMLKFLSGAEKRGRLLIRDSQGIRTKPVKSMSIRIDEDGGSFIILHDDLAADLPAVLENPS